MCFIKWGDLISNASKFIKDGSGKNASRLIKAIQGLNEQFYKDMPKGVFGSKAIIECNGAVIKSDELDIEFSIPFDDDLESNEAEITIYNLSNTTLSRLAKGKKITVTAGFTGDTGVIFTGYIDKQQTSYEGVDRRTTLNCVDRVSKTDMKELTYKSGTKASTILKDLINKTGTPIAVFKVRRDHTYKDEVKVDGNLMENIKNYAKVCGISVYIKQGKIYARYLKEGDALNFVLSEDTGLIGSPTAYTEEIEVEEIKETINGYECESLLQHRFSAGAILKLKSREANGTYRVMSGEHTFNISEATTKIKVF